MKKYHVGYVQGTFDLFHIGHLNLLQNAKKHCEILCVGVVSDEYSQEMKGIRPCIDYAERSAIVKAIDVVDAVFKIEHTERHVLDVWDKLRFDCFFSGDDHMDDDFLQSLKSYGVEYMFFPYTQHISSTRIKEKLRKRILFGWAEDYPFDELPPCIAIYGAGNFGKALYDKIFHNTGIEIKCWVDKNAEKLRQEGLNVELPQVLLDIEYDKIVVAVKRRKMFALICQDLLMMGIPMDKIVWVDIFDH